MPMTPYTLQTIESTTAKTVAANKTLDTLIDNTTDTSLFTPLIDVKLALGLQRNLINHLIELVKLEEEYGNKARRLLNQ